MGGTPEPAYRSTIYRDCSQNRILIQNDAARQVEATQRNALADYGEFYRLKRENQSLLDINQELESELNTLLEQLAIPSLRNLIFAVADALIGDQSIPVSSRGGGGNSDSDLRWDGRRPDEEEEAYRRRYLLHASRVVMMPQKDTGGHSYNICNDLKIQIHLIINRIAINLELILLSSQLNILRI